MDLKKLLGVAGLGVVAVVLAWLAIGRGGDSAIPEHQRARVDAEDLDARSAYLKRKQQEDLAAVLQEAEEDEVIPLDEDPRIRRVTPNCRMIITKMRRNTPSDTLLDMIRDQSLRFDDDDIQCMSVGGAKPAILDMANWQRQRN